ncbi:MAG: hypothetical protein WCI18_00640 [Pseudomonadota bacterium]
MKWILYLSDRLLFIALLLCFLIAGLRIHLGVESTVVGYQLGRLKESEAALLEKRSQLLMQYSKMTTKPALARYSEASAGDRPGGRL